MVLLYKPLLCLEIITLNIASFRVDKGIKHVLCGIVAHPWTEYVQLVHTLLYFMYYVLK